MWEQNDVSTPLNEQPTTLNEQHKKITFVIQ